MTTIRKVLKLTSYWFVCVITIFAFSANVFAEYYVVYPGAIAVNPCCKRVVVKKHYYKKKYKRKPCYRHYVRKPCYRPYVRPSCARVERYDVYQSCRNTVMVPRCGTACSRVRTCNTCDDFYVPERYIVRETWMNGYYMDPWMDLRTSDDF